MRESNISVIIVINNCRRSGEALKNPGGPGGKVGSNGDCGGGKVKGRWKSALSRLSYGKR